MIASPPSRLAIEASTLKTTIARKVTDIGPISGRPVSGRATARPRNRFARRG